MKLAQKPTTLIFLYSGSYSLHQPRDGVSVDGSHDQQLTHLDSHDGASGFMTHFIDCSKSTSPQLLLLHQIFSVTLK